MIDITNKRYNLSELEVKFKTYLRAGKRLSYNTTKNYLSDLRYFLGWQDVYNNSPSQIDLNELVSQITPQLTQEYKDFLINTNIPTQTINRRLSSLRSFLDYCIKAELTTWNPARHISNVIASSKPNHAGPAFKQKKTTTANHPVISKAINIENNQWQAKKTTLSSLLHQATPIITILILLATIIFGLKNTYKNQLGVSPFNNKVEAMTGSTIKYQGELTDSSGMPIFQKTNISFKIYDLPEGGNSIYTSGVCEVTPNKQGTIAVTLGDHCGGPIDSKIFTSYQNLYLGITVGADNESRPRQQLANIGTAQQAQSLSGLTISKDGGAEAETIPYINEKGELAMAVENPRITSSDGVFQLSGQAISLITERGSRGNITIAPDNLGNTLIARGNVGIGTSRPSTFKLQVAGDIGPNEDLRYNLGSPNKRFNEIYANKIIVGNTELKDNDSTELWTESKGALASTTVTFDILTGSTATSEANIKLAGKAGNNSFINQGNVGIGTRDPQAILDVAGTAHLRGATDINGLFVNSKGFVGIGNTNPSFELDLTGQLKVSGLVMLGDNSGDTVISKATDWQFHHDTSFDLKDGSLSALSIENGLFHIDTQNSRIGIGTTTPSSKLDIVGGNCADNSGDSTGCTADYAELYPTSERVEKGDLLAIDENSDPTYQLKTAQKNNGTIIGIVSSYPAVIIDGGKLSLMNNEYVLDPRRPAVALAGRVPVKIALSSRSIKIGDKLTSSIEPGRAEKSTTPGMTIGTALESWEPISGKDKILTFVNISWYEPDLVLSDSGNLNLFDKDRYDSDNVYQGTVKIVEQNGILPTVDGLIESSENNLLQIRGEFKNGLVEIGSLTVSGTTKLAQTTIDLLDATLISTEKLIAQSVKVDKLSAKEAEIMRLRTKNIEAETILSKEIKTDTFEAESVSAQNATISGTLTAKNVEAENIKTELAGLTSSLTDTKEILSRLKENKSVPQFTTQELEYLNLDNNPQTETDISTTEDNDLFVYGKTTLFDTAVLGTFTSGNIGIQNDTILSLSPTLNLIAESNIDFFGGAFRVQADGSIIAQGPIIAKGGLQTNEIKSLNGSGLSVILNGSEGSQEKISIGGLSDEVASIDNSGAAKFSTLSLNKDQSQPETTEAQIAASIKTASAAAGSTTLPSYSRSLTIYNDNVSSDALIYLTATSSSKNRTLFVSRQESCESSDNLEPSTAECTPHFIVEIDDPISTPIKFNWWIIK